MAIDPMLYEKVSGRSADPSKRLGQALAQSSAQRAATDHEKSKPASMKMAESHLKMRLYVAAAGVVGALILIMIKKMS